MKRLIICAGILLAGCASSDQPIRDYVIRDPQFTEYKATLDQLESDYLDKKITYDDYLKKKKQVEDDYQQEIDGRLDTIQNQNPSATPAGSFQ